VFSFVNACMVLWLTHKVPGWKYQAAAHLWILTMANNYAIFVYDEEVRFLCSGRVIHAYCRSLTDSIWCEYPFHHHRRTLNLVLSVSIRSAIGRNVAKVIYQSSCSGQYL
jgi:hypothetical protein